jgi:hypothetical protein
MATPICYVSGGLGAVARTPLESTNKDILWNLDDLKVRMVPDADAASILRHNPQDFAECVFLAEGYGGLTPEQLAKLAEAGSVHVETYYPKAGDDPLPVLVLDSTTAAGITAAAAPKKAPKKGKEE